MRSVINQILKNPRQLFIVIITCIIAFLSIWYSFFYKNISETYRNSLVLEKNVTKDLNKYKGMEAQINTMETNWNSLNSEFQFVIERIPDKRLYESVTDYLYSDILQNNLQIINFSPSNIAIEKENIFIPETDDEILVEKIPIDITLRGSFIDLNQFLEGVQDARYRFTTSDVGVSQSKSSTVQTIELIAYAYFQSSKNKIIRPKKIQKNKTVVTKKNKKSTKEKEKKDVIQKVDNNVKLNEDIKNVPEMWLEPATEPIEELADQTDQTDQTDQKNQKKNASEKASATLNKNKPAKTKIASKTESGDQTLKDYNILSELVVLQTSMCKKIKNNLPVYTSETFDINDEKVICYSLVRNNTKKSKVVYHVWYMNGELKAKARIKVRPGKEIPAISNRKVNDLDIGKWKIVVTDVNKMILDTVIFEVV